MTDEQPEKPLPSGKSILEGTLAQTFGGAVGTLYVLNEASKNHYFPAGYELALGTVISVVCYVLWKLVGKRIIQWAGSDK